MKASALDDIQGVGPARAKALIRHFGSVAAIREADVEQIALVPGVGMASAQTIRARLRGEDGMLES